MASSPYLSQQIKTYIQKHDIQTIVNRSVNSLLKNIPQDPFSFLISQFQKLATPDIELQKIKGIEHISGDNFPAIKIQVTCLYMNKSLSFTIVHPFSILSDESMLYDQDRHSGKGQKKGIQFLQSKILPVIVNLKCSEQAQIDSRLVKEFEANNKLGIYQINIASFLPSLVQSHIFAKPLYEIFMEKSKSQNKELNVMINCLQGGKAIGSKCKVFKYLLLGKNIRDPWLIQTVLQAIRKTITSGKGGQAALKLAPDATWVCPLDTIMDNLKIVEDAINNSNAKEHFTIGLSWQADTFFTPDTKKYELQNPKTPFDNDQMIDYLVKLLTDKPIISYFQDPLAPSQKAAWAKLINKIKSTQSLKHVQIGSRAGKLFDLQGNLKQQINQICIPQTADSHPQSTEQNRTQANSLKFSIDCVQFRAYQLLTLTNIVKIWQNFKKTKTKLILQDCTYQTYDTTLIDLCYGLGAYANLGSISKFDRISKLNRMQQLIEQQ